MMTPDEAFRMAAAANLPHLPLFEGARAGQYELAILGKPADPWPSFINKSLRPRVVLLGDDPYPAGESLGPAGWACARAAKRWARAVIVHGTGPHPDHYRRAGYSAIWHRYVVLVETSSDKIAEWVSFFDCSRTVTYMPPPGQVHPCVEKRVMH